MAFAPKRPPKPIHACVCKEHQFDYTNAGELRRYLSGTGKIRPRKMTGLCGKCQRKLTTSIKRARVMALLPFSVKPRLSVR